MTHINKFLLIMVLLLHNSYNLQVGSILCACMNNLASYMDLHTYSKSDLIKIYSRP